MKIKQIVILILVVFGIPAALFVASSYFEAYAGSSTADFFQDGRDEPVWYPAGVEPGSYQGLALPAVLLISDEFSINNNIRLRAEQLNAFGYIVRVPDLYDGRQARGIPATRILRRANAYELLLERVRRAWRDLLSDPLVDPARVAVAGFDLGAELALSLGREDPRPALTLLFYPGELPASAEELGLVGAAGPVAAFYAELDERLSLTDRAEFASLMSSAGREFDQIVYEGTRPGFVQTVRSSDTGASIRAWLELLTILQNQFLR